METLLKEYWWLILIFAALSGGLFFIPSKKPDKVKKPVVVELPVKKPVVVEKKSWYDPRGSWADPREWF